MDLFCKNATVVLVHGAWADGSSWNRVILPLLRQGLKVIWAPAQKLAQETGKVIVAWGEKRIGDLIDDLLAFSRIGQSEMQKMEVNLDELIKGTWGDFQAETKDRKIAWTIHELPAVWADIALLRLVVVNLISNALKFTGGRTEAKTKRSHE
jgi:signal transduction histidine kinase